MRRLTALLTLLICFETAVANQTPGPKNVPMQDLIFVIDQSRSMADLPDTSQALVQHGIGLGRLSGGKVRIAVILFNGRGVKVLGSKDGLPTAAYSSLEQQIHTAWEKPAGGTPLDEALERLLGLVSKVAKSSTRISVVLSSDGEPESGRVRPQSFPEVKAAIDKILKGIQDQYKNADRAFVAEILRRKIRELQTPGTKGWNQLWEIQKPLELKKCKEHASALRKFRPRIISVDYAGGIAPLQHIHLAAGGRKEDYKVVQPASRVIEVLHESGVLNLPGVLVQPPRKIADDPAQFQRTTTLSLNQQIAEAALVTVVFEKPVPNFDRNSTLEAIVDSATHRFRLQGGSTSERLSVTSAGHVVAAHLSLPQIPQSGKVLIRYLSPNGRYSCPACTIYTHLKLSRDVKCIMRPAHLEADAQPTFAVATTHQAEWILGISNTRNPAPIVVKNAELILTPQGRGQEVALRSKAHPHMAGMRLSDPSVLPSGRYDGEVVLILSSGEEIRFSRTNLVQSQLVDQGISIDLNQKMGTSNTNHPSQHRGHIAFETMGDQRTEGRVDMMIRPYSFAHSIRVKVVVDDLQDPEGNIPSQQWIQGTPKILTLRPGQATRLSLRLKLPKRFDDELVDGRYKGLLTFVPVGSQDLPLPVKRFQEVVGAGEDPVNQITFELKRPAWEISSPRSLIREACREEGNRHTIVVLDTIGRPFSRSIPVSIGSTGGVKRKVDLRLVSTLLDEQGRAIPSARIVLAKGEPSSRDLHPGEQISWQLFFEADESFTQEQATALIEISAEGMPTLQVQILVLQRSPLLGETWSFWLRLIGALLMLWGLIAFFRWWQARKTAPGSSVLVTPDRPLEQFSIDGTEHSIQLTASEDIEQGPESTGEYQRCRGRSLSLVSNEEESEEEKDRRGSPRRAVGASAMEPVLIQPTSEEEPTWQFRIRTVRLDPPALEGEFLTNAQASQSAEQEARRARLRWASALLCLFIGQFLFWLPILRGAQWLYDLFNL